MDYDQQLSQLIQNALQEDIGNGDHSTLSTIDIDTKGSAELKIKEDCIIAGMHVAECILKFLDKDAEFISKTTDGNPAKKGSIAFEVKASIHAILSGERLVLNCMQRMSGIATLTKEYTKILEGYHTKLLDTRKTTPNFRLLEKEAVRIGGGTNHRFGLYDMIMLKDNHIDYSGGIDKAINLAYDYNRIKNLNLKIEVEARNLDDVKIILKNGKINRIMLDNFTPEELSEALKLINHKYETEASGGINLNNLRNYAETGVDFISSGAVIHQAKSVDLSLKAQIH